jgi:hypothetical protein
MANIRTFELKVISMITYHRDNEITLWWLSYDWRFCYNILWFINHMKISSRESGTWRHVWLISDFRKGSQGRVTQTLIGLCSDEFINESFKKWQLWLSCSGTLSCSFFSLFYNFSLFNPIYWGKKCWDILKLMLALRIGDKLNLLLHG